MDFSNFPNPRCYDRYLQFHGVETNPKIQIAKNLSCIQYRNLSLLTRKIFFLSWGNLTDQVSWSVYKFNVTWRDVTWRDVTWRDVTWRDATLFTRSPVVELLWNFWIIWVRCRVPYSCWTILFTKKKIKRPPLKVKKCLSNKTWVPLGPSTLGPNGSGGGPLLGGWEIN